MKKRILGGAIVLIVLITSILLGDIPFAITISLVALLGLKELIDIKYKNKDIKAIKILSSISMLLILLNNTLYTLDIKVLIYLPILILILPVVFYNNKEKYNINDEIVIDKFGKPHFLRTKDSFNISHSGNYVVIAVSRFNIGIDIQRMEKNNQLVAERNFHQNECTYINEGEDENVKTQRFYEVWTVKEAYLKNVGIGLRKPLNSFEVNFAEGKAKIMDNPGYEILQMKLDERYIMSVCADIRDKELNIEEVAF